MQTRIKMKNKLCILYCFQTFDVFCSVSVCFSAQCTSVWAQCMMGHFAEFVTLCCRLQWVDYAVNSDVTEVSNTITSGVWTLYIETLKRSQRWKMDGWKIDGWITNVRMWNYQYIRSLDCSQCVFWGWRAAVAVMMTRRRRRRSCWYSGAHRRPERCFWLSKWAWPHD